MSGRWLIWTVHVGFQRPVDEKDDSVIAAETENREAERSTCQTGFKGVEVGHTPGAKTADRHNFLSLSSLSALRSFA